MHLVQILLPLYDNEGVALPRQLFARVRDELTEKFGGLTAHTSAPAEGVWRPDGETVAHDEIVVFEVMAETLDETWWGDYRRTLERLFRQEAVLIRATKVRVL
jgi:hypothetical protein